MDHFVLPCRPVVAVQNQNQQTAGEEEVGKLRAQVREVKVKEQSWVGEREGLKSRIASLEQQAKAAQAQRDEAQRQKEEARAQVRLRSWMVGERALSSSGKLLFLIL